METTTEVKIDDDEILAYVKKNYNPEDVFEEKTLEGWALDNDFIKEE